MNQIDSKPSSDLLRNSPSQGGPNRVLPGGERQTFGNPNKRGQRRVQNPTTSSRQAPPSVLKKLIPYLFAGGSTGLGMGLGLSDLLF